MYQEFAWHVRGARAGEHHAAAAVARAHVGGAFRAPVAVIVTEHVGTHRSAPDR